MKYYLIFIAGFIIGVVLSSILVRWKIENFYDRQYKDKSIGKELFLGFDKQSYLDGIIDVLCHLNSWYRRT